MEFCRQIRCSSWLDIIRDSAVAGLKMVHLLKITAKITAAFDFSVLTLMVPGLRFNTILNDVPKRFAKITLDCAKVVQPTHEVTVIPSSFQFQNAILRIRSASGCCVSELNLPTTPARDFCTVSDRVPRARRVTARLGAPIPAPIWVPTG